MRTVVEDIEPQGAIPLLDRKVALIDEADGTLGACGDMLSAMSYLSENAPPSCHPEWGHLARRPDVLSSVDMYTRHHPYLTPCAPI